MKGLKFLLSMVFALSLFVSCDNAATDDQVGPKDKPAALTETQAVDLSADLFTGSFSEIFAEKDFTDMFSQLVKSDLLKELLDEADLKDVTSKVDFAKLVDLSGQINQEELSKLLNPKTAQAIAQLFTGSFNINDLTRADAQPIEIKEGLSVTPSINKDPMGLKLVCVMYKFDMQEVGKCSGTMIIVMGLDKTGNIAMTCNTNGPLSIESDLSKQPITVELTDVKIGYALVAQPSLDSLLSVVSGKPDFDVSGTVKVNGVAIPLDKIEALMALL